MNFQGFVFKTYIIFLLIVTKIKSDELKEKDLLPTIAVIPFKIFFPLKVNNYPNLCRYYLENIHSSLPYLEIEIGENIKNKKLTKNEETKIHNKIQILSLFISIDDNSFYIDDNYFLSEEKNLLCRYSTELSTSYEIDPSKNIYQENKNYFLANDIIKIYSDIYLRKYDKIKIEFKHIFDKKKNISFACGKGGLLSLNNRLNADLETNFINQIHSNLKNVDYSFTFKFEKNNSEKNIDGILIIGLESIEKNKKNELIPIYINKNRNGSGNKYEWRFGIDQITIGNQLYEFSNDHELMIKADIEGIEIPYSFYNQLNKVFFNNYYSSKICQTEIVNNFYIMISCNIEKFTKNDIQKFPEINFLKIKIGYNFSFSGEELFYQKDNLYIFKIISFLERYKTDFKLGRIFLKKYQVIFNSDSNCLLFYKTNNLKKINNNQTNIKIGLLTISYILIGILFLGIGIYFGKKFCKIGRRIYANELEDDNYIYESKNNGTKKERKLLEL